MRKAAQNVPLSKSDNENIADKILTKKIRDDLYDSFESTILPSAISTLGDIAHLVMCSRELPQSAYLFLHGLRGAQGDYDILAHEEACKNLKKYLRRNNKLHQ